MQDTNSDSYYQPEWNWSLFHGIKHHPLRHLMEKLSVVVPAQRGESFSADRRNKLNLAETRSLDVEEKVTLDSLVTKVSVRSLIRKETSKRSRHKRISTQDLELSNLDPYSETTLTYETPETKICEQRNASHNRDRSEHNMVTLPRRQKSSASTHFLKQGNFNQNKDLLFTFLQDPVSSLVYHFHKQQMYRKKMMLTRPVSFPVPHSSLKRHGFKAKDNGFLPKEKGKFCFGNKTQKYAQFESSNKNCELAESSGAKRRANGNFNVSEEMTVREASCSGSDEAQNPKEIKHFKSLKQKIGHVTGDSRKEKLRVTMDAVIHKLPQGQGISDELKKEIFKRLTETLKSEYPPSRLHKHDMRRIRSLQEPLDIYCQNHENSFNKESTNPQCEELKLRTAEEANSELSMVIPLQRILSLPDLQSFSNQNEEFSDISSQTKPIMDSKHCTKRLESVTYQKEMQLETPLENLVQEDIFSLGKNGLRVSHIVQSRSDFDKVGMVINDFGHCSLRNCDTFNEQDIEANEEYKAAIVASVDSKSNPRQVDRLENMDSLKMISTTKIPQKVDIQSNLLNHEIPQLEVDTRHKSEFNYVKFVLEISGLTGKDSHSSWHSSDHPVDPLLYEEMEGDPEFCTNKGGSKCDHHVLFDLINETILEIHGRPYGYFPDRRVIPNFSDQYPCNIGCHRIYQVWTRMNKSLSLRSSKGGMKIDDHVRRDLEKCDEWVNMKLYAQSVGLEIEDLIFHDLLEELIWDFACL